MKLATLKGGRDGRLVTVSDDLARAADASAVAATMQAAIDDWANAAPGLESLAAAVNAGETETFLSSRRSARPSCRAPINGSTAAPISAMSSWSARRAARRCRRTSTRTR